jgi:hypothetical protein
MERSVALTCHRPFAIRDEHIKLDTFRSYLGSQEWLTYGTPSMTKRYVRHLEYCLLQTEICAVNISNQKIRPIGTTYSEWVVTCEQRVGNFRDATWTEVILIPDWVDLPAWRCLAWLYMPCPRNPNPSNTTITKFIDALIHISDIYWALSKEKSLRLCWFAVHTIYEIGIQLLYCLQNYSEAVHSCFANIRILDTLTHLSDVLVSQKLLEGFGLCL